MKQILLISLLLLATLPLAAQTQNVDSLVKVLESRKLSSHEQILLCRKISKCYWENDVEKSIRYEKAGLSLAEKEKDGKMIAALYNDLGISYSDKACYDTAHIYLNKAVEWAIKSKDRSRELLTYLNLGTIYHQQGMYATALDYFTKALDTNELNSSIASAYTNIAVIHIDLKNWDRAIEYLNKALEVAEKINWDRSKLGVFYNLGVVYTEKKDYNKGLEYLMKGLELSKNLKNKAWENACSVKLSALYTDKGDYKQAMNYINESLRISKEMGDSTEFLGAYISLSEIYRKQKRYKESEIMAMKAWAIDSTINNGVYILPNLILDNIYLNNKEKAEHFLWKYQEIFNDGMDTSLHSRLSDMEVKYETQKKEMRIATLEKERKLYTGLGIAVVAALLLGLGLLFYRHRLAVQKQKQLEKEKELIAARSALDAEKAEREIIARDLHDGVGAMLSVVKNNMTIMKSYSVIENTEVDYFNQALDGLDKSMVELRRVAHHIMPAVLMEKGLFAALDDFCRSIPEAEFHYTEPERRFDPEKELVLYRCAYELVNNSLKHAKASHIEVHLNVDETAAYLSVVDNGCGFDLQNTPQGMGLKNLHNRLSAFGGNIDIYSEQGKGTEANVELKGLHIA